MLFNLAVDPGLADLTCPIAASEITIERMVLATPMSAVITDALANALHMIL